MQSHFMSRAVDFIAKHAGVVVPTAMALGLFPLVPAFLWGVRNHALTYGDLLDYWGSLLASAATVLVAFIAIYQQNCAIQAEKDLSDTQRMEEIRPHLLAQARNCGYGVFELTILNESDYPAHYIHIFDWYLCPRIVGRGSFGPCTISYLDGDGIPEDTTVAGDVSERKERRILIDDSYFELNCDDLPDNLFFIMTDLDGNMILEETTYRQDGYYEPTKYELA